MESSTPTIPTSLSNAMKVLVVEDDASLSQSLRAALGTRGYAVTTVTGAPRALEALDEGRFDIVLTDLRLSEGSGLEVISACTKLTPPTASVLMSAYADKELALHALKLGARDYLPKPFEAEDLLFLLRKLEEREQLRVADPEVRAESSQRYSFSNFIAKSEPMRQVFATVKRLAPYSTTVLITGESGTGKELLAQALHYNSPRRGRPFVAINCGAIPETLMESELFGHKKGAFTDATRDKKGLLEEASGGTVFLDEIGEMPLHLQVKLLRALQEQQIRRVGDEQPISIDMRVIAATLRDLEEDVRIGRFREDLYYRLNVVTIHLPPLRERPEDIPLLVQHFIKKHVKRLGIPAKDFSTTALEALFEYSWRGNVRELENCVERALVLSESSEIELAALPPAIQNQHSLPVTRFALPDTDNLSIKQRTRDLEIELIQRALEKTGGNRTRASKVLEISHRALLYKLKEYGLSPPVAVESANDQAEDETPS